MITSELNQFRLLAHLKSINGEVCVIISEADSEEENAIIIPLRKYRKFVGSALDIQAQLKSMGEL